MVRSVCLVAVALAACTETTIDLRPPTPPSARADASAPIEEPRIDAFSCQTLTSFAGVEPVAITVIPAAGSQQRDAIAILSDAGGRATLLVTDGLGDVVLDYPNETPRAVHGFLYGDDQPALAVATSRTMGAREVIVLHVYEWRRELVPANPPIVRDCPEWRCGVGQAECGLNMRFQTRVTIDARDVDGDLRADLLLGADSDLPIITYYSSRATSGFYQEEACSCARFSQAPSTFVVLGLGGLDGVTAPEYSDLVFGSISGTFVKYAEVSSTTMSPELMCGQPARLGSFVPVRDLARAHFQAEFEDVVVVSSKMLGASFDDPGQISVVFGAPIDLSSEPNIEDDPEKMLLFEPRELTPQKTPIDPRAVAVGDVDGDRNEDFAVLYGAGEEVHLWLGDGRKKLVEDRGISLPDCGACVPMRDFALADLDADGKDEILVVCNPTSDPFVRRYNPAD